MMFVDGIDRLGLIDRASVILVDHLEGYSSQASAAAILIFACSALLSPFLESVTLTAVLVRLITRIPSPSVDVSTKHLCWALSLGINMGSIAFGTSPTAHFLASLIRRGAERWQNKFVLGVVSWVTAFGISLLWVLVIVNK